MINNRELIMMHNQIMFLVESLVSKNRHIILNMLKIQKMITLLSLMKPVIRIKKCQIFQEDMIVVMNLKKKMIQLKTIKVELVNRENLKMMSQTLLELINSKIRKIIWKKQVSIKTQTQLQKKIMKEQINKIQINKIIVKMIYLNSLHL